MKKFILHISACFILLSGCRGQEQNDTFPPEKNKISSIKEKQQSALRNQTNDLADNGNNVFNFRYAAKKATPGVVHIKSTLLINRSEEIPDFFKDFFDDEFWRRNYPPDNNTIPERQTGSASGVIVTDDGYIVTNNHVVDEAESIEVVLYDQRTYKAKIIGTDPATDLALLKIEENKLPFIEFGNSDSVEVGDMVLAVGNPFNLASTVTAGIVSAKARNINLLTDRAAVESYIQTDAAVNRGNSGGALVDSRGKLIGINAAISTPTGVYAGYSFAIPVEIVKKIVDDLLKHGKAMRGFLGVIISNMTGEKAKQLGIAIPTGVMVDSLQQNGAALRAGVKTGDIIIKIDNHTLETATQLREIIARHRPGETVELTVIRNGIKKILPVKLLPDQEITSRQDKEVQILTKLGIEIENLSPQEKVKLKITSGIKITGISKGIIARATNIREGFIITNVNSIPVKNTADFINIMENKKGGVLLEGIYPDMAGVYYYAFGI